MQRLKMIGCFNHRVVAWLMLVPQANCTEVVNLFPPYFLVPASPWKQSCFMVLYILIIW